MGKKTINENDDDDEDDTAMFECVFYYRNEL